MRLFIFIVSTLIFNNSWATEINASFACSKASTLSEKRICSSEKLSALDKKMANAYTLSLEKNKSNNIQLKKNQREWNKNIRDKLILENSTDEDLVKSYETQIEVLKKPIAATYQQYDPAKNRKLVNKAITGECLKEHQEVDNLDFELKMKVDQMNEREANKAVEQLKDSERKRWFCIEKELNKSGYTLNLKETFKINNL
ncbi:MULTISPECIES: lysozyme inhibitor LprI family protein [Yersinia]|uniref:Uncharacterized protein conserved in bacteria, putative lipoprotein n=1 Tax=Yersinia pekkanenii TaxID=1288385 RepID=A0ABP1ZLH1_9GAMM|nr:MULTISPECIES: hypothetical protein [Yersinia]CNK71966.1 Uncharacterized protein conserved in bacteria%2C putative lipoprotein [Yersinia pseudotuberculosis]CRY63363.1 Uncharacterized protein conserved in bacteria%2C putative lipoprotein [Yersinia pekkanenii]